jgi:hypothetical protein
MTSLLAALQNNWMIAIAGGGLFLVVLIYATAVIRVWRMGKSPIASQMHVVREKSGSGIQVDAGPVRFEGFDTSTRQPSVLWQPDGPTGASVNSPVSGEPASVVFGKSKDVTVYAPRGETRARGIAIVLGVSIEAIRHRPTDNPVFQCRCGVALHGLEPSATASPAELKITGSGDRDELVTLKAIVPAKVTGPGATVPGISLYGGIIYQSGFPRLVNAVRRQMGDVFPFSLPPSEPAYCRVEVRLPDGEALERHRLSGIKMDFELYNEQKKDFLIQIPSGVSIGPLLL